MNNENEIKDKEYEETTAGQNEGGGVRITGAGIDVSMV